MSTERIFTEEASIIEIYTEGAITDAISTEEASRDAIATKEASADAFSTQGSSTDEVITNKTPPKLVATEELSPSSVYAEITSSNAVLKTETSIDAFSTPETRADTFSTADTSADALPTAETSSDAFSTAKSSADAFFTAKTNAETFFPKTNAHALFTAETSAEAFSTAETSTNIQSTDGNSTDGSTKKPILKTTLSFFPIAEKRPQTDSSVASATEASTGIASLGNLNAMPTNKPDEIGIFTEENYYDSTGQTSPNMVSTDGLNANVPETSPYIVPSKETSISTISSEDMIVEVSTEGKTQITVSSEDLLQGTPSAWKKMSSHESFTGVQTTEPNFNQNPVTTNNEFISRTTVLELLKKSTTLESGFGFNKDATTTAFILQQNNVEANTVSQSLSVNKVVPTTSKDNLNLTTDGEEFSKLGDSTPREARIENSSVSFFTDNTDEFIEKSSTIGFHTTQSGVPTIPAYLSYWFNDDCSKSDGVFAHSQRCGSYVVCTGGVPRIQTCPSGLLYNPTKRSCDSTDECGSEPRTPTSENADVGCECENCLMPDAYDCTRYYLCMNGTAYDMQCSEGLQFSPEMSSCDYEGGVDCAKVSTQCSLRNGFVENLENCSQYYNCVGGVAYAKECEAGLHFNAITEECDDPCLAGCDTQGCIEESSDIVASPVCEKPNGFFSHPDNCRAFYKCSGGVPEMAFCIDDEHFSPIKRICQDPCEAMCDLSLDCYATENPTTNTPNATETQETSVTFGFTTEIPTTSTFETTKQETSSTSTEQMQSDKLISVTTSISPTEDMKTVHTLETTSEISSSAMTPTGPYTESLMCEDPDGIYPMPGNCNAFYVCVSGIPVEQHCDEQLHFSPVTLKCEYPCYAECDPTVDCSTTSIPEISSLNPYAVCPRRDLLPGRTCTQYINCTSGVPKTMKCPSVLYFNPTARVCDWRENSACGSPQNLPAIDYSFNCPYENCLIPSDRNCAEYHLCVDYKAYAMKCSNGLLFDDSLQTCNHASKVHCRRRTTTTQTTPKATESTTRKYTSTTTRKYTTTTSTTPLPEFKCPTKNGYFQKPGDCGKFYQCSNWRPYVMKCPSPLHFSKITQRCEYPCDAKCDLTLSCYNPSLHYSELCPCVNCRVKNPESCTKYIDCKDGRPRNMTCDWGKTFDPKRQECDWAHKVECHSQTCPTLNGLFPYKGDCNKFIHCSNGIPYVNKCSWILEFDPVSQRCSWPTGMCGSPTKSPPIVTTAAPDKKPVYEFECPKEFGVYPHKENCSRFYHCSYGTAFVNECSRGLLYNPKTQTCDWKEHVKCDSRREVHVRRCRVYDRRYTCPRSRRNIPHVNCDMYYDCSTGSACSKRCPSGLYFNSKKAMCDYPQNVQCPKGGYDVYSLKEFAENCRKTNSGFMTDPAFSNCYYQCHHEKVIRNCCPRNATFNRQKNKCEHSRRKFFY